MSPTCWILLQLSTVCASTLSLFPLYLCLSLWMRKALMYYSSYHGRSHSSECNTFKDKRPINHDCRKAHHEPEAKLYAFSHWYISNTKPVFCHVLLYWCCLKMWSSLCLLLTTVQLSYEFLCNSMSCICNYDELYL